MTTGSWAVDGRTRGGLRALLTALYTLCALTHLLLPVQAGLPTVGSIHVTTLTLGGTLAFLAVFRPFALAAALRDRFTLALLAFGVLGAFTTYAINGHAGLYPGWEQLPLAAGNAVLGYLVNLAMLRLLGTSTALRILLVVGAAAAVLTVVEGLFGFRLPPYEAILHLQLARGVDIFTDRAQGPLGNSLVTSMMLSLVALIAMAESKGLPRVALVFLAISGALLTGSKTALIVIPILLAVWFAETLRDRDIARARVKLAFGGLAALAVLAAAVTAGPKAPIVGVLTDRLVGAQKDYSDLGAEIRRNALVYIGYDRLLGDPGHLAFGAGSGAAGEAMEQFQGNNTVDNLYLALAYDFGVPVACLYMFGLFGPFVAARKRATAIPYFIGGGLVIAAYGMSFDIQLVTTVMFLITAFSARCRFEADD